MTNNKCYHWTCNGCDKCGGWKSNLDAEKACVNSSCECHSICDVCIKCDGECHVQVPYGFVPHAGCPLHDKMTEEQRTGMTEREENIKELFDMVYEWGRANIVTDFESNAFRKKLKEIIKLNNII